MSPFAVGRSAERSRRSCAHLLTPPRKTRLWGFGCHPSGRLSRRSCFRPILTPGCRAYGYKTAAGRLQWPNRDPIGEEGGVNLYAYINNNPVDQNDPLGQHAYGNPLSGPNGPVGPSDPYSPGGAYYVPPAPSCMENCLNSYPGFRLAFWLAFGGLINAKGPFELRQDASLFTTIDRRLNWPLGKGGAVVMRNPIRGPKPVGPLGTAGAAASAFGVGYMAGAVARCACECSGR
jgi:hypothetical protein